MGSRALIAETFDSGKVKYFYSQYGAENARVAGDNEKPKIPEKTSEVEIQTADSLEKFAREIDSVIHEAIWINGDCYYPKSSGEYVTLFKCETGKKYELMYNWQFVGEELQEYEYETKKLRAESRVKDCVEHSCLESKHGFHPCRGRICKVCGRTVGQPLEGDENNLR